MSSVPSERGGQQDGGLRNHGNRTVGRSPFDDIRHTDTDPERGEFEWWSAREAMPHLGYVSWESFENVIQKAKSACRNTGSHVADNFRDVTKVSGQRGPRSRDTQLTRFAMYLVAMNGDPDKKEIAAAQRYFVIQTRRAEVELPPPPPQFAPPASIWRPYSLRLSKSLRDHRRFIVGNLPFGSFSVLTATIPEVLLLEDVLLHHLLPLQSSDLPDGSIGQRFSRMRRDRGMEEPLHTAPLLLPDRGRNVMVKVYPVTEWLLFQEWLNGTYFPNHLPNYWGNKFLGGVRIAAHSAADRACLEITCHPAHLPAESRRAITSAPGGIVRAPIGTVAKRR